MSDEERDADVQQTLETLLRQVANVENVVAEFGGMDGGEQAIGEALDALFATASRSYCNEHSTYRGNCEHMHNGAKGGQ